MDDNIVYTPSPEIANKTNGEFLLDSVALIALIVCGIMALPFLMPFLIIGLAAFLGFMIGDLGDKTKE